MKIAIDARTINSTTGRYIERLLHYLQKIDSENTYIILVRKKDFDYWQPKAKNFITVVAEFNNYSLGEQIGFMQLLYKLDVDLVHFCMPQQPLLYLRPHITTVHDITLLKTYNSDKNWLIYHFKQFIGRFVFFVIGHSSKHILTSSHYTKKEYLQFSKVPKSKVTVAHLGADIGTITPRKLTIPFKKYIMYVGQQSDYKNIKRLIQAHQQLRVKHPELGLILVGSKNESAKRNEAWANEHGFKGIHFTGFVSNEELAWLYKHTSAYVFPSLMEGFGLPALEAMACGAPVASSNATCLPEVYGNAAIYFNPLSVQDMASVVEKIITNPSLKDDLIKKGYAQLQKYSWEKMALETHQIYKKVLGQ